MKISNKLPQGAQTIISFGRIFVGIALKLEKGSIHVHTSHPTLQQTAGNSKIDKKYVLNDIRLQNSRVFFFSKSLKKSEKRGVRVLCARATLYYYMRNFCNLIG